MYTLHSEEAREASNKVGSPACTVLIILLSSARWNELPLRKRIAKGIKSVVFKSSLGVGVIRFKNEYSKSKISSQSPADIGMKKNCDISGCLWL